MSCKVYELGGLSDYKFVVVLSKYNGRYLFSRHKNRLTWETQGGHIEKSESSLDAAKRELYEESGAVSYSIVPVFDYFVQNDGGSASGVVFIADISELSEMPDSEMAEVGFFTSLPLELTYPDITPVLFSEARERFGF